MILVTGGTGFIGQVLVRQLVSLGYPVRLLLNPSMVSPHIHEVCRSMLPLQEFRMNGIFVLQ